MYVISKFGGYGSFGSEYVNPYQFLHEKLRTTPTASTLWEILEKLIFNEIIRFCIENKLISSIWFQASRLQY